MNTNILGELYTLNNLQNDPIVYKGKEDQRVRVNKTESKSEGASWLQRIFHKRNGRPGQIEPAVQ